MDPDTVFRGGSGYGTALRTNQDTLHILHFRETSEEVKYLEGSSVEVHTCFHVKDLHSETGSFLINLRAVSITSLTVMASMQGKRPSQVGDLLHGEHSWG